MVKNIKRFVLPGFVGAIAIVLIASKHYVRPERISEEKYRQVFDEITSMDVSIGSLTPDYSGDTVAYIHSTENGRGLSLIDLKSLERKQVPVTNEVTQVYGWSRNDRYLVFLQIQPSPKQAWLTLYDRDNDSVRRLTKHEDVTESSFTWLTNSSYFFVSKPAKGKNEVFCGNLQDGTIQRAAVQLGEDKFVAVSDETGAFAYTANIYGFQIKPAQGEKRFSKITQLTEFAASDFDSLQWLRYDRENGRYLFCSRPNDSTWRFLFQYNPKEKKVTQLSHEDTYNGQWLQNGTGFAYVINTNNSFQLAVRTDNTSEHTNLFETGSVVNYTVSPTGERIYITGCKAVEPYGIWEYELQTKKLRQIFSGMNTPFVASRVADLKEYKIKSFDGLEIPCFLVAPVVRSAVSAKSDSFFKLSVKYPAVIYIPPPSSQYQRNFGPRSQFLANIGFYFLAVNYRGCDGYGRDYSNLANTANAAQDILAAYRDLLKNPNVDKDNIYIFSMSGGTSLCMELIATVPKLWRGLAIDKPGEMGIDGRFQEEKLPPFLLLSGDQDPALPSVKRFQSWATTNGVNVECVYYTNSAHVTFGLSERKNSQNQVAQFFLNHLKK